MRGGPSTTAGRPGAAVVTAVAGGLVLIAEGIVFATDSQDATDILLLAGVALTTIAFVLVRAFERVAAGTVAGAGAVAIVAGAVAQIVALAVGLASEKDLDWLHGIGFLVMGLGFIVYGVVAFRRRLLTRMLAFAFIGMPIVPIVLGELVNAFTDAEGTTIVWGVLWLGVAALLVRERDAST